MWSHTIHNLRHRPNFVLNGDNMTCKGNKVLHLDNFFAIYRSATKFGTEVYPYEKFMWEKIFGARAPKPLFGAKNQILLMVKVLFSFGPFFANFVNNFQIVIFFGKPN